MNKHKTIIIFSDRLELYYLIMKHFGSEYGVSRYGYSGWQEKQILPFWKKEVVLFIIEIEAGFTEAIDLVRRIRLYAYTGFLLFISKTEERCKQVKEKICAIDVGVDEYLAYPQTNEEIIASMKALLRRLHWKGDFTLDISGKRFQIDAQARKIFMDGIELVFTKTEFAIMSYMILHLNRAVSYKELYEAVWEKEYLHDDRNIMAHIHRMRKKMGDDTKNPQYIKNVYGTGYMVEGE